MKSIVFLITFLLLFCSKMYCDTIEVPSGQPTIQAGIDVSSTGDTVLVAPGNYFENINFNGKNVVVGSYFLTTNDTAYISQTVINGSKQGCVVVFADGENSTTVLTGFTITNGYAEFDSLHGGGITCHNAAKPRLDNLIITGNEAQGRESYYDPKRYGGGGILCTGKASPVLYNVKIRNNTVLYGSGGGLYCNDSSVVTLLNSEIENNTATIGGGAAAFVASLDLAEVVISENESNMGGGLGLDSAFCLIEKSCIKNNFSHARIGGGGGIYATNSTNLTMTNSEIKENSTQATSVAAIHRSLGCGLFLRMNASAHIENCKIHDNHSVSVASNGGGICIWEAELILKDSEICGNSCKGEGGGLFIQDLQDRIILENVLICHNSVNVAVNGGGLFYLPNKPVEALKNVVIRNNFTEAHGGGLATNRNLLLNEASGCSIFLNYAMNGGSDIYMAFEDTTAMQPVHLDTVTNSIPRADQIHPFRNIDLIFKNAAFQSVNADLYVSPSGSNTNSGITPGAPLKSINHALLVASADSLQPRTIFIAPGTYSPSTNEEIFPLYPRSYLSISGDNPATTILDGENKSRLIEISESNNITLENFTVQHGSAQNGGGMQINGNAIVLKNLIISENSAELRGGGLYVFSSQGKFVNLTVVYNQSGYQEGTGVFIGARFLSDTLKWSILNSIITSNSAINFSTNLKSSADSIFVGYSNIGGGFEENFDSTETVVYWLNGNIDKDPLFIGGDPFDYNLMPNSPCINSGASLVIFEGDTLLHLSKDDYIGSAPDMGALESPFLTTKIEQENIHQEHPYLVQNHPNPFDTQTTIRYFIPGQCQVQLKIFDVLGREIKTLVNQEQQAGSYEVGFNMTGFPSGIYFCKLQVGRFIQTMKMIRL